MKKHNDYSLASGQRFSLPVEIHTLGLSAGAIAVYSFLIKSEDGKDYSCFPSYRTIGKAVSMSANSVRKYVKELTEKCLIQTEPRKTQMKNGRRRNSSLRYTILPIDVAVTHFHAEQMAELNFQSRQAETVAKAESIATKNPGSQFRFTPSPAAAL